MANNSSLPDWLKEQPGETWVWILTPYDDSDGEDAEDLGLPEALIGVYNSLETLRAEAARMGLTKYGVLHARVESGSASNSRQ